MRIAIIGGTGFIGINLVLHLSKNKDNEIIVIDCKDEYFSTLRSKNLVNVKFMLGEYNTETNFEYQVSGCDIVYHLASTTIPGNSNNSIPYEIESNLITTANMLEACVKQSVKKVIFISSGGAIYGNNNNCPISEAEEPQPISSYGLQKLMIEKLLYLYYYQFNLDYKIIRLANPYGPYQRPNGKLGVVTTFVYRALTDGVINVYGDGKVIRDYIFIDDAIKGIISIADSDCEEKLFNLGSGRGTSINEIIELLKKVVNSELSINYTQVRKVDVKMNYLSMSKYEKYIGKIDFIELEEGIRRTMDFMRKSGVVNS